MRVSNFEYRGDEKLASLFRKGKNKQEDLNAIPVVLLSREEKDRDNAGEKDGRNSF